MRSEFEVYRKEVVIKTRLGEQKFELLPLKGRFYKKLINVLKKFPQGEEAKGEDFLEKLDEETVEKLHELVFETLKYSKKVTDKKELEDLDMFVSQNLFAFIPGLVDVNLGSAEE